MGSDHSCSKVGILIACGRDLHLAGGGRVCIRHIKSYMEETAGRRLIIYSIPWVVGE